MNYSFSIFALKPLVCRMLTSWSILVAIPTCIIFSNSLVRWLMRLFMVRYSEHFKRIKSCLSLEARLVFFNSYVLPTFDYDI